MTLKIPPPPPIAVRDPALNRWLLELTSILNASGGIDPNSVAGLAATTAQVASNTANISTLSGEVGTLTTEVATNTANIATNTANIATNTASIATLQSNPIVHNGAGAPAGGLGNVNDWYADTANAKIYVKTAVGTWTVVSAS